MAGEVTQARGRRARARRGSGGGEGAGNGRPRADELQAGRDEGVSAPRASRVERRGGSNCGALRGRGLITGQRASSIQPRGSREDPSGVQLCKQEEGRGDPGERGEECCPSRRPGARVAAGSASLLGPDAETCCNQQATAGAPSRQRRSGWAGEREGKAGGRRGELVGRPGVAA